MPFILAFLGGFAGADIDAAVAEVAKEAILKGDAAIADAYWRTVFINIVPLSKTNPEARQAESGGHQRPLRPTRPL